MAPNGWGGNLLQFGCGVNGEQLCEFDGVVLSCLPV
jgi:hypothetical protein